MKAPKSRGPIGILPLILFIAALANFGRSQQVLADPKTEIRTLSGVSKVQLMSAIPVDVQQGERSEIRIEGNDTAVDQVRTIVEGDTIVIKWHREPAFHFGFSEQNLPAVNITLPQVNLLSVMGSGNIRSGEINGSALDISVKGSGDVSIDRVLVKELNCAVMGSGDVKISELTAINAVVAIAGSGDVSLKGAVVQLEASVLGSGDLEGSELSAERVAAFIAGSGDIVLKQVDKKEVSTVGFGSFRVLSEQ